ncbi:MAG: hypothetical protein ABI369_04670 [Acetobacteraceae bacterium]
MSHPVVSRALVPAAMLLMLGGSALAQNAPNTPSGARPGNVIGTGESLPRSNKASNTPGSPVKSQIAPNLPSPNLGPNAGPADYLQAAHTALAAGKTGEAQQALEMAQTRALDRSVPQGQTNNPSQSPLVNSIGAAIRALGSGNRGSAMQAIDAATAEAGRS